MKNKFIITLFFVLIASAGYSQNIDSLKEVLAESQGDKYIVSLNNLASALTELNPNESINYAREAENESRKAKLQIEEARSYLIQGIANMNLSRYDFALFFLNKSFEVSESIHNENLITQSLLRLAQTFNYDGLRDSSILFARRALIIAEANNFSPEILDLNSLTGLCYYQNGNLDSALFFWDKASINANSLNLPERQAEIYNNIGVVYRNKGENQLAISNFQKNLEIQEKLGDSLQLARSLANIGNIYYYTDIDLDKSLDYYLHAYSVFNSINDLKSSAFLLNSIALVYLKKHYIDEATTNFNSAIEVFQELDDEYGIAYTKNNLSGLFLEKGDFEKALRYSYEALEVYKNYDDDKTVASIYTDIGKALRKLKKYPESISNLKKAAKLYESKKYTADLYEVYHELSYAFEEYGNINESLKYFRLYNELKDQVISDKYFGQVSELEAKYNTERNQRLLIEEKATVQKQKNEIVRKNIYIYSIGFGLFLVIIFSLIIFKQFREKKFANILLGEQNMEITYQNKQIISQKKEITDSIEYASKIQKGLLPSERPLDSNFEDYFVFFLPRNIVSGDFYWVGEAKNHIVATAADSTGHGVPGAFMSILGLSFLKEIVVKDKIIEPSEILGRLRKSIIEAVTSGSEKDTKDGIDMSLISFDIKNKTCKFSGAYNSLFHIRDKELTVYKADRMPIGAYIGYDKNFSSQIVDIQKGDQLYMFSDGFHDQFGGPRGKKYGTGQFKRFLLDISEKSMTEQEMLIRQEYVDWKRDNEQVDDILIMAIKI